MMSFRFRALSLSLLVSILLALPVAGGDVCPLDRPDWPDRRPNSGGLKVDSRIDTREACPSWRWVAIQRDSDTACPVPVPLSDPACAEVWKVRSLFQPFGAEVPSILRPFCLYSTEETGPRCRRQLEASLEALVLGGDLEEVESGCAAVGPMSEEPVVHASAWPVLEQRFLASAGALPVGVSEIVDDAGRPVVPSVRVAILDTEPGDPEKKTVFRSDHGIALARLVETLLGCEDGAKCAADVTNRLALPMARFDWNDPSATHLDPDNGGYFGTIDQLGQAAWEELEAWRTSGETHLVLHLAVAWVGERFGGLERDIDEMPVPVQALYRALEVAACEGALVVAASGNRVGGPEIESGPLLPGGWERRPAPTREDCVDLSDSRRRGSEPLVYAAGGIHADGAPLVNARAESEPARVAYSDHAVVAGVKPSGWPSIFTGSSVATSVVAAAAAAVWHHRPGLSRAEVMTLVEASGRSLDRLADIHVGARSKAPPSVRRIAVCGALRHACADPDVLEAGARCPSGDLACPDPSGAFGELAEGDLPAADLDVAPFQAIDGEDFCESVTVRHAGSAPSNPCPFYQFFGIEARPWTGPQPQDNPCIGCDIRPPPPYYGDEGEGSGPSGLRTSTTLTSTSTAPSQRTHRLSIFIDPEWKGGPLESPTLCIGSICEALSLDLDADPNAVRDYLLPGDLVVVEGIPSSRFRSTERTIQRPAVHLQFQTRDGSVESPVYFRR